MANPVIHLQRYVDAYALNARSAIPLKTVIDGALRPTTDKQRKESAILVRFAGKDSQSKNKELHQMKIKKEAQAVAFKAGLDVEFNWSEGVFNIMGAKVESTEK